MSFDGESAERAGSGGDVGGCAVVAGYHQSGPSARMGMLSADLEHQSEEEGKEGDGSDAASEDHEVSAI